VTQTETAPAVVEQRIRVLDEPEAPAAAEGRMKKAVLTVAVFFVLGVLLSLGSVVLAASLDRTVRVPNDITARFGVDVLAVVPNATR
jgi:capsular polysaccharide biosynthesis protein